MAIFVIVADDLDDNHPRTINILIAAGYQIAMVNNRGFRQPDAVPESVAFVIEGHNIGRDIVGCIRVLHTFGSCSVLAREARILFLNDPVISVPGARPVFERLAAASEDWVRVTEGFRGTRYVIPTEAEFDPPAAPPHHAGFMSRAQGAGHEPSIHDFAASTASRGSWSFDHDDDETPERS